MRHFTHLNRQPENISIIYGIPILDIIVCNKAQSCREIYQNIEEVCNGYRVRVLNGYDYCPCEVKRKENFLLEFISEITWRNE